MNIFSLEIQNLRGIKEKLNFSLNEENFLIYGPNGTGKSAIVDAIDFLLTGKISRLTGKGAKDISLKLHGPHIDVKALGNATVRATIKIPGVEETIDIERSMSSPNKLIYPEDKKDILEKVISIAKRGHYVLSRREILKFVAAESGKRAEEVQAILNLATIEEIRKALVRIETEAKKDNQTVLSLQDASKSALSTALSLDIFSEENVRKKINEIRAILGGEAILKLSHNNLQEKIKPPSISGVKTTINLDSLNKDIEKVKQAIKYNGEFIFSDEAKLRTTLRKLKEDKILRRDLANRRLIELGISLIDESEACPLCLSDWKPGELKKFLQERLLKAKEAAKIEAEIKQLSSRLNSEISIIKDHIERIKNACQALKQEGIVININGWISLLDRWSKKLVDPIEGYDLDEKIPENIKKFLAYDSYLEDLGMIKKVANEAAPELTPEQKAWDCLTRMSSELKRYFELKEEKENTELFYKRATIALKEYEKSRDKTLLSLYDSVKGDFVKYYKELHGADESQFDAKLEPSGAGLDFEVDFYGRGYHPPLALHSEGHQDSMGLCLYLALSERLSEGKISLTILDDVVMSIDSDHRKDLCKLLKSHFSDRQFFITTHDRTWARQLKTDGVVSKKNMVEFKSWSVESGPSFIEDFDFWDGIHKDINNDDIPAAAAKLRRNSEYFFERACDHLLGKIIYKGDGRWELGDYLPGTIEAYKKYLKKSKLSAKSWEKDKTFQELEELESVANEIIKRSQIEQWGINENVHYSKWGIFSKNDFIPIVEAFKDLHDLFKCSKCQGLLFVTLKNKEPQDLRCLCGQVNYNLLKNPQASSI